MARKNCPHCGAPIPAELSALCNCRKPSSAGVSGGVGVYDRIEVHQWSVATTQDGLPVKEEGSARSDGGLVDNFFRVNRAEDQYSYSTRARSGFKTDKERDQITAVKHVLGPYNKAHQTDYGNPVSCHREDDSSDVIAVSASGRHPDLHFQITKLKDQDWYEDLARTGSTSSRRSDPEFMKLLWDTIEQKVQRYGDPVDRTNLVLIVDVWGPFLESIVQKFKDDYHRQLATTGFQEMWLCGRNASCWTQRLA